MTQTAHFAWAIDLPKWSIFKMVSFLKYLLFFFQRFFAQNNLIVLIDSFSGWFWRKIFLTQTAHFAWAIDLTKWSIFKMVSFLEFWLFFPAAFCTEQLNCSCRFIFGIFLEKKIFDPNFPFCMGYRLTKMVDFQNGLISRILAVFWRRFFAQNMLNSLVDSFSAYFFRKNFLTQTPQFAYAIDLPKWPVFKMLTFLEFWLFFPAVFCT